MRILINDHAGHPFQIQLSRCLARRGHTVLHTYTALLQTPRGKLSIQDSDPDTFDVTGICLAKEFSRYSTFTRFFQERELGHRLAEQVESFRPDAVVSANAPLGSQTMLLRRCRKKDIKFVFWVQDLLGVGIQKNLSNKLPFFGSVIGGYYIKLENSLLGKSDEVVIITEDFEPLMQKAGLPKNNIHTIYNWAPLDEMPLLARSNDWARQHGLVNKCCLLYSGTMGMKHNPELLLRLALHFKENEDIRVVVISEGLGAEFLKKKRAELNLDNLLLMDFLPFETLPAALASADILVAILEPSGGVFAVPSKVLSYMCAAKPLLLAVPSENLAARMVVKSQGGIVVSPQNGTEFVRAADRLVQDGKLRESLARNARTYAETHFDIDAITDKFERVIMR